jgi:hypothetical protein
MEVNMSTHKAFYQEITSEAKFLVKFFHPISRQDKINRVKANIREIIGLPSKGKSDTVSRYHYDRLVTEVNYLLDDKFNLLNRHGCVIAYIFDTSKHGLHVQKDFGDYDTEEMIYLDPQDGDLMVGFSCVRRERDWSKSMYDPLGHKDMDKFNKHLGFRKALHNSFPIRRAGATALDIETLLTYTPRPIAQLVEDTAHRANAYFKVGSLSPSPAKSYLSLESSK